MNELVKQLAGRRCFVLARLKHREGGKVDKIPMSVEGYDVSAMDSAHWMTGEEAQDYATLLGCGIGVVLGEPSGLACIDLDHSFDPVTQAWAPYVGEIMARFPGCYFEVSQSNTAAHLFFSVAGLAEHGTRIREYTAEVYTRNRFIYLTGTIATGDARIDHTAALSAFITEKGSWNIDEEAAGEWRDTPVPGFTGVVGDQALLDKAVRAQSAQSAFGNRASFTDLWSANTDKLAQAYPPQGAGDWDYSAADLALANSLAFWTAGNHERVAYLMRSSGLSRDKWENRKTYLRDTIAKAIAGRTEFYGKIEEGAAAPVVAATPNPAATLANGPAVPAPPSSVALVIPESGSVGTILGHQQQTEFFAGWTYIRKLQVIQFPDGDTVNKQQCDDWNGGRTFVHTVDGKTTTSAWDAFTKSPFEEYPKVVAQCFIPALPLGAIRSNDLGYEEINCYKPIHTKRVEGDPAPFIDFIHRLLPNGEDADILIYYMAACLQHIGTKFKWCPFVYGAMGNGKSTIGDILEYCIGHSYSHRAKAEELMEKFNEVFVTKLLVVIDEVKSNDKAELQEVLKSFITAPRLETRPFGASKQMSDVCFNLMVFSNYPDGIRIDANERRYAPLFTQTNYEEIEAAGLTPDYFVDVLRPWLEQQDGFAIVNHYLSTLDIPERLNPAKRAVRAPVTTSWHRAIRSSLGPAEQEVSEAIESGRKGFKGGWATSVTLDQLLASIGKASAVRRFQRPDIMRKLGYIPHPALGDQRVILGDGQAHLIYIQREHPWARKDIAPIDIIGEYTRAQLA